MCFRDIIFLFGSELSSVWSSILIHWQDSGIWIIHDFWFYFSVSIFQNYYLIKRGDGGWEIWKKYITGFYRISGPAGPGLVKRIRPDLMNKYKGLIEEEKLHVVSEYLFHCNAHKPSGESAFHRYIVLLIVFRIKLIKQTISLSTVINKS